MCCDHALVKKETLTEHGTGEAYRFVPKKIKLVVLALLRAAPYSRFVAAS